jgi:hypothetical protein
MVLAIKKKIFKRINRLREIIVNIAGKEIMINLYWTKNLPKYRVIGGKLWKDE